MWQTLSPLVQAVRFTFKEASVDVASAVVPSRTYVVVVVEAAVVELVVLVSFVVSYVVVVVCAVL